LPAISTRKEEKQSFRLVRHEQVLRECLDLVDTTNFAFEERQLENVEVLVQVGNLEEN
jgi:hypothetical protein